MARKRFPSDGRPWFRVTADVLDDARMQALAPADRWAFVALLAAACKAKSRDGRVELNLRSLAGIFGLGRVDAADRALDRLASVGLLEWWDITPRRGNVGATSARRSSNVRAITLHKWPELQGTAPRNAREIELEEEERTPLPRTRGQGKPGRARAPEERSRASRASEATSRGPQGDRTSGGENVAPGRRGGASRGIVRRGDGGFRAVRGGPELPQEPRGSAGDGEPVRLGDALRVLRARREG